MEEIFALTAKHIEELVDRIMGHAGAIYRLCEAVSLLDVLVCLAEFSASTGGGEELPAQFAKF